MGVKSENELAVDIIVNLMGWDDTETIQERKWLKLMVDYKFDHYQGYGSGVHFYISLTHWLGQIESKEAKRAAAFCFPKHADLHAYYPLRAAMNDKADSS